MSSVSSVLSESNPNASADHLDRFAVRAEDTILLVIDIQERLVPAIDGGEQVVARAGTLIQAAGHLGLPILVTEQYPRGLGPTVRHLRDLLTAAPGVAGIFEKITFTACTDEVIASLTATGRRKVIITGMETHVCVFQTARHLLAQGFQVFVAEDAVSSRTTANKQNGLQLIAAMGGVISNMETLLFDLLRAGGTPQFKMVSKLVK